MIQIPISNIPNQSLSINLDDSQYDIRIHSTDDHDEPGTEVMAFDIVRNGEAIVTGMRALSNGFVMLDNQRVITGFPIIPSRYLEDGNFLVLTAEGDYPDWNQFGITQYLIFASQAELNELRGIT